MSSDSSEFISREELLGGLPARRASTLLFAIESRTAHLMMRSRQAMARFLTERSAAARERAFLDAVAQGRDLPVRPTVRDLERYAPVWSSLLPTDAGVRATLARMLGEKYLLAPGHPPAIQQAIGVTDDNVRHRFQQLHGRPIESIFAAPIPVRERLR